MKKVLLFFSILSTVLLFSACAQAEDMSEAYLEILDNAEQEYGKFKKIDPYFYSTGIGYVSLIDFDGNGTDELLYCTGKEGNKGLMIYEYNIYSYENKKAKHLVTGSMDCHGGEVDWSFDLFYGYNHEKCRIFTYRYGGVACSSKYITIGEYSEGIWKTYTDWIVEENLDNMGGEYYKYYFGGSEVEKAEYDNRFHSLSRGGIKRISYTDFSGEFLESVRNKLQGEIQNNTKDNQTDWESGQFKKIMQIDDYIYYFGLHSDKNGVDQKDGRYAICLYNAKTREDKTILPQAGSLQRVGNKLWASSGFSTGDWSRNLCCFDIDGTDMKHVISGTDVCVSIEGDLLHIYNGRIYIGHNIDMEHFEVISCDFNGNDIRIEVDPVSSTTLFADYYDTYAVIDGEIYPYIHSDLSVMFNDKQIAFDTNPIIKDDRTLVPMRAIFEAMGCEVVWDDGTIDVWKYGKNIMTLWIDDTEMWLPSGNIILDVPPQIVNDRTLVPIRAISESMGARVEWDGDTRTVKVFMNSIYSDNAGEIGTE